MRRIQKTIGMLFLTFVYLPNALAGESKTPKFSSLCSSADLEKLQCENERDCAFKTEDMISLFLSRTQIPKIKKPVRLKYPRKCYHRSYERETVNLVFEVNQNGAVSNVQILNSSNECFDRQARNNLRKLKFENSNQSFKCMPWTVSFTRNKITDSSGNRY